MKTKLNIQEKIIEYLVTHKKTVVSSVEIKYTIAQWMMHKYGLEGNLSVDRKWRNLKEPKKPGDNTAWLKVEEIDSGSKQSSWKILALVRGNHETPWVQFIN